MISIRRRWQALLTFLTRSGLAERSLALRLLVGFLRPLILAARKFHHDRGLETAAALSFVAILSMIPLGFLFFFFMGAFGLESYWEQFKTLVLQNLVENAQQSVADYLGQIERNPLSSASGKPLFIIVIAALVVSAVWLLEASEKALNRIWGGVRKRSRAQRYMVFWSIVTASPFLLAFSAYLKIQIEQNEYLGSLIGSSVIFNTFYGLLVPVIIATFAFFFVYLLLPAARVQIHAAMAGAVLAGFFWELAKIWMSWSIPRAVTYSVYGSLGAIAAFFIWFYMSWSVVLLGAQLSYVVQHPREALMLLEPDAPRRRIPPDLLLIAVASELAAAAAHGTRMPTLTGLAERWSCPREDIEEPILRLTPRFFHQCASDDDVYYLSLDSDRILLKDLLALPLKELCEEHVVLQSPQIKPIIELLSATREDALAGLSIRDVCDRKISLHRADKSVSC